jgi:hypothetical protein
VKTIALNERIFNISILDITVLSYKGDHMICESHPLLILPDESRVSYEEMDCEFMKGHIKTEKYEILVNFKYNDDHAVYCLDKLLLTVEKKFIQNIFKNC